MRITAIIIVLTFCGVATAQNYEGSVKKRLNEQHNDKFDKAYFNKKFGAGIKIIEFGKPFDLADCEIDAIGRQVLDSEHPEVWKILKDAQRRAGVAETRSDLMNLHTLYSDSVAGWSAVPVQGKGIRVKYERLRGGNEKVPEYNLRKKFGFGIANPTDDLTFLLDRKGVIFAEFDSEHLRHRTETSVSGATTQQSASSGSDVIVGPGGTKKREPASVPVPQQPFDALLGGDATLPKPQIDWTDHAKWPTAVTAKGIKLTPIKAGTTKIDEAERLRLEIVAENITQTNQPYALRDVLVLDDNGITNVAVASEGGDKPRSLRPGEKLTIVLVSMVPEGDVEKLAVTIDLGTATTRMSVRTNPNGAIVERVDSKTVRVRPDTSTEMRTVGAFSDDAKWMLTRRQWSN